MSYEFDWSVVFSRDMVTVVLIGLRYTILVSLLSLLFGNLVGLVTAILRVSRKPPFAQIAYIYTDFFRTTPALVQLIWIFYVLPIILGVEFSPITSGVIALSLNAGAFLAEVFRGGLELINTGQRDAASVLGLSKVQAFLYVLLPQAFRRVLPATGNVLIGLIKDLFASYYHRRSRVDLSIPDRRRSHVPTARALYGLGIHVFRRHVPAVPRLFWTRASLPGHLRETG